MTDRRHFDEMLNDPDEHLAPPPHPAEEGVDEPALGEDGHLIVVEEPSRRTRRRRRRARGVRRFLVLLVTVGLVAGAGFLAVDVLRPLVGQLSASNDYPGPGTGSVEVTVNPGDTGRSIGATLERVGVVKSAKAFVDAASENPAATTIQPGTYGMRREMKASDALAILLDTKNRSVPRVTIREGLWASEIYAELSKTTGLPVSDYQAAAKDAAALGLPEAAKGNIEGYLFPDTYEFPAKATAAEQLRTMVQRATVQLARLGVDPAVVERVMVVASLVESEGRRAEDRPKIARVIENRLARKPPMKLQLDSSVNYGVGKRSITTTDAERADKNPFNTYVVDGLPAGPVSNPGLSAIEAAIRPADGPWLYFVAVNPSTGETRFATTEAEHAQNVALFQKWCAENKGKC